MSHKEFEGSKFDAIQIGLASDEDILTMSKGEVTRPETINYRTHQYEKAGLFCQRIFGPQIDGQCLCGKYKKMKFQVSMKEHLVCDRCGVEPISSKERRVRMGHIDLAVPIVHIWFNKTTPSQIGNLLGKTASDLERVIYYEDYIVIDPMQTPLEHKQLLTEGEYRDALHQYGSGKFVAKMGGEAVRDLLAQVKNNLKEIIADVRKQLSETKSNQTKPKLAKRLKILESFDGSDNNPVFLTKQCIPVIPPDLRPLVPLDGGRFATSDLNDLYRRVINRNNRLKRILGQKTPEVIVRNEKRMLQEAVDALFDNGRHGHPVLGAGNRPLKSLSEMLKGKQGRFRQNLLGKRVDFSGRSVIVVGPELKFNQCGLPKQMALTLFEPFIIRRLKEVGLEINVRRGRKMIQEGAAEVWDALAHVVKGHPILLNRAPTLHRLGIQAFEPVLIEGKAIRIHPLVCTAFNADFDGDQMAVHIPLSLEAQIETRLLMMGSDNIFSPAFGKPITVPSQDMILGLAYLMVDPTIKREESKTKSYSDISEVLQALYGSQSYTWYQGARDRQYETGRGIHIHEQIRLRIKGESILTTPGRVVFNQIVPEAIGFVNNALPKKRIGALIGEVYRKCGLEEVVHFLDALKNLGFSQSTKAAISMGIQDIIVPPEKKPMIEAAQQRIEAVEKRYEEGFITGGEKTSEVISIWTEVTDVLTDLMLEEIKKSEEGEINPLYLMMESGARGNKSQIKQLGAMRGMMTKPSGEVMERAVTQNFREGLDGFSFFTSSHGARKGLADTALKTADSGYLTRRLVDVAQDVIITEPDCGTLNGFDVSAVKQGQEELLSLKDRLYGRTVCNDIYYPGDLTSKIASAGDTLNRAQAESIDNAGIEIVKVRSPMACETRRGICAKCYGYNLARGKLIGEGEAVGIIAAQSIGEPGTQLTMRTFHTGGTASVTSGKPEFVAEGEGLIVYENVRLIDTANGPKIVASKNGQIHVVQFREGEKFTAAEAKKQLDRLDVKSIPLELGAKVHFEDGAMIKKGDKVVEWDQHYVQIITEKSGYVVLEDIIEGVSSQRNSRTKQLEIKQFRGGELHPRVIVYSDKEKKTQVASYFIPAGAILALDTDDQVEGGAVLARLPRGAIRTKDITGGLPRIAELFEARKPKDAAEIAKIDGQVFFRDRQKQKHIVVVMDPETGAEEVHNIPVSKHVIVSNGDMVSMGQQLTDGTVVPHEILDVCGVRELQRYLVNQVQEVYRLQGVEINDKHVEVIIRQMLQKIEVVDSGDTTLILGEIVDKKEFHKQNDKAVAEGNKPAMARPVLLGITKASLGTESFISAASFQETTRVLTLAASSKKIDLLCDFKSNVIVGNMIPAGTGFAAYKKKIQREIKYSQEIDDADLFAFMA